MLLWQKLASVRGTYKLAAFGEDEPSPRGCGASRLAGCRKRGERSLEHGFAQEKNHLNFKKQMKKLVSAAETGGNSPRNMGTAARLAPEEASRLGGSELGRGQLETCAGLPFTEGFNQDISVLGLTGSLHPEGCPGFPNEGHLERLCSPGCTSAGDRGKTALTGGHATGTLQGPGWGVDPSACLCAQPCPRCCPSRGVDSTCGTVTG